MPSVLPLIRQFNDTIESWIQYATEYSLADLRCRPGKDAWSMGQLITHLILDTGFHVNQIKMALTDQQFADRPMHSNGIAMLADNQFPDIQIAGDPSNDLLKQPVDSADLVKGLLEIQQDVNQLYKTFDFASSSGKSEHPGLWYFTAIQWLQFTEMHMRHHFRQKKRIDEYLQVVRQPGENDHL